MNTIGTQANPNDDDMPAEIDFSKALRGKCLKPGAALNVPVYLDFEIQAHLEPFAHGRGPPMTCIGPRQLARR